mgnify:FL=1
MKGFLQICIVVFSIFVFSNQVNAQNAGWEINNFDVQLEVLEDGSLQVTETIDVNFIEQRRGIYRDLPIRYRTDLLPRYEPIGAIKVLQNNAPAEVLIDKNRANVRIRVGNEYKYITGPQKYIISYTVDNVIKEADNGSQELYWNVTGNDWDTVIESSVATVAPSNSITSFECFQGEPGSTDECDISSNRATATDLTPGEGLTIQASWPAGTFKLHTVFDWQTYGLTLIIIFGLIFLTYRSYIQFRKWQRHGDDTEVSDTVVVQYHPYDNVSPSIAGMLSGDHNIGNIITATIFQLGYLGYLSIDTQSKQGFFGNTKTTTITIDPDKDRSGLHLHEIAMLNALQRYTDSENWVLIADLKNSFYSSIPIIKSKLTEDMMVLGLYERNPRQVAAESAKFSAIIILIAVVTVIALFNLQLAAMYVGLVLLVLPLVALPGLLSSWFMTKRTEKGDRVLEHMIGYREFIETAEQYRARFYEDKNLLFEVLPYAAAFGLVEKLKKQLGDMKLPSDYQQSNWINSSSGISSLDSVGTISKSLSRTMTSSPSSSSGGGSSGGGSGGGGGGSW